MIKEPKERTHVTVCNNCGSDFLGTDALVDDNNEKTEEVCDECGSSNLGYDAWVKNIGGELVVVGGPYDNSQCLNERCEEGNPNVRDVLVKDLKDCDGKDCYYNGDKSVMKEVKSTALKESYWYCSNCIFVHLVHPLRSLQDEFRQGVK